MPKFTTSDGLNLYYDDQGNGQPMLCLAGLTRNRRDFDPILPHLPNTRIIRLDYRGRGGSDYDPDFMNYAIPREALDAVELLDHLGLDRVTLLGTSRGGLIAMGLAATHRDRLAGVILNDIGPVIDPGGLGRIMDYVGRKPAAKTHEQAALALAQYYADEFPGVDHDIWLRQSRAMYEQKTGELDLLYDPKLRDALIAQAEAGDYPDLWPFFEALNGIPTAVIRGANSDLLTAETLTEMHARHADLISATIPDRGHVPFLDEPDCLSIIRQILGASA